MSDLVDYLRSVNEERCNVEPLTVAKRCAAAAARVERLEAFVGQVAATFSGLALGKAARAALEGK